MVKDLNKVKSIRDWNNEEKVTQGGGLVMLAVDLLYPHPDNPRKKLGDLTELSESIKAKGVMQNLTVVPRAEEPGTYTIIIGHRRHGAAKKAGLSELPCVIVEMSEQEQIATMLLENIQRSDLTAYEQAKGFQMMMDFGDSVSQIVEKTGFSESTVRRRLKMAELDEETLERVSARQLSLGDFDKLADIDDIETRNKVLQDIGTNNFNNSLKSAIDKQKLAATVQEMKEKFNAAGLYEIPPSEYSKHSYQFCISGTKDIDNEIVRAQSRGAVGYYYSYRDTFYLMSKKDETAKVQAQNTIDEKNRIRAERVSKLSDAFKKTYELRREFIDEYSMSMALKNITSIAAFLAVMGVNDEVAYSIHKEDFEKMLFGREWNISSFEEMKDSLDGQIAGAKALLVAVWFLTDNDSLDCVTWDGGYQENENLNMIYEFLESLGYLISDEERELIDGSSELYKKD